MGKAVSNERPGSAKAFSTPAAQELKTGSARLLSRGFPLMWFAVVAFIIFGQSIRFNYTYFDDQSLVMNNLKNLQSPSYVVKAFSEDVFHAPHGNGYYYRPLLTLSFMADAMIGKGSFGMFHFSNIIYHIAATFLLFMFFAGLGYDRYRSFLFGLLFLVHPMITQAVAWVPGRNDTLLAIFILGSFLFWMSYLKSGRGVYIVLHLLLYAMALFTKENAIVLPFLVAFYYLFIRRTPVKKLALPAVGWVIITVAWAIIRFQALDNEKNVPLPLQILSVLKSLPAVLPFTGKIFFPFDLSVFPILADMKISVVFGVIAIGILLAIVLISKPKLWLSYCFGILWFLAFLLPSFVSVTNQIPNFSEHRVYLSMAGIFLLILATGPVTRVDFARLVPASLAAGLIVFYSVLTFLHTRHFRDNFTFWQNAVDTSPSHAFNYNNLGAMYYLKGDYKAAEPLFRDALKINPHEPMANSNAGLVCMNTGRPAEAEKLYLEEIRINPAYDHAYFNLGLLYYNHSRHDEGIRQWEKTLTINPGYIDAYKALLFAYKEMDRKEDYDRIVLLARQNGVMP